MAIVTRRTRFALDELVRGIDARGKRRAATAERPAAPESESERERRWRDRFAFPPLASFPARFIR